MFLKLLIDPFYEGDYSHFVDILLVNNLNVDQMFPLNGLSISFAVTILAYLNRIGFKLVVLRNKKCSIFGFPY